MGRDGGCRGIGLIYIYWKTAKYPWVRKNDSLIGVFA